MAQLTYAEFKAKYQHGYGLATSTQLGDAYRQYQLKGTLPGAGGTTAETTTPTTTTPAAEPTTEPTTGATPNSFAWWLETYHPGSHTSEELIALQPEYVAWYNAQAFPPGTMLPPTTPTVPTTPTTPTLPTVPAPPVMPTITMPTPPTPPTIVTPTMPEPPVMPEPPKIEIPEAPTPPPMPEVPTLKPPVMPEVPTVPPYEPSPEQAAMEAEYADELAKWREAGGYGIPEETQIQMIQRATDILKAREAESIRVMKDNMESREITNSGFVFANEMTIKSNTTLALANSITDVQINSALMKMASFEKMMGSTAQFIGYLAQESAKAYAPKLAQWGMEAQYGLVGYEMAGRYGLAQAELEARYGLTEYEVIARYEMAGYSAEVAGVMAQAQIDAQYGLTAVEIEARYGLTEYQAQVAINNAQAQIEAQYGLAGYAAQVQATLVQFQTNTLAIMADWQARFDLIKMEINQAYNLQNMQTLSDLQLELQNDQQAHEEVMAEWEFEMAQESAKAEAGGTISGSIVTGIFAIGAAWVCWIVDELYGLDTVEGKILFYKVNYEWHKTFIGEIGYKLYKKFGKRVALFISKKGILNFAVRKGLKLFFDYQLNTANNISEEGIVEV